MAYTLDGLHVVDIGWTGENNATSIVIDVEKWMTRWPDAKPVEGQGAGLQPQAQGSGRKLVFQ